MENNDYEGWPTTRCYPRTLAEAFPDDVENAEWFYPPEQRWQDKIFLVVNVCLWVALAFYFVKD
jgi:hypothetical protein